MVKNRVGLYPGTFDPITVGHYDIIRRASKLVDTLVIGVAMNPGKNPLFTVEERVEMVAKMTEEFPGTNFEVKPFNNLLMHFAEQVGAAIIIRGLRRFFDGVRPASVYSLQPGERNCVAERRYYEVRVGDDGGENYRACEAY